MKPAMHIYSCLIMNNEVITPRILICFRQEESLLSLSIRWTSVSTLTPITDTDSSRFHQCKVGDRKHYATKKDNKPWPRHKTMFMARSVMCIFVSEKAVNVGQNSTLTWIPKMWRFLIHLFVQLKFFDIVLAYILYSSNIYLPPGSLRYLPLFVLHPTKTDYPTLALWLPDIILWILMIILLSSLWQTTAWLQIQIWT